MSESGPRRGVVEPLLVGPEARHMDEEPAEEEEIGIKILSYSDAIFENENVIITSRYTLLNFLPRNLFEQFRRLANVYFLVIGIIALVGAETRYYESAVDPLAILLPMFIVVFISVIKDGIEDIQRHQADARTNAKPTHIVQADGYVVETQWKDLRPGDIVFLVDGNELPADIVVLACGGVQGQACYVETAAIDGETNLKLKLPCLAVQSVNPGSNSTIDDSIVLSDDKRSVSGVRALELRLNIQPPTEAIEQFNGTVSFRTAGGMVQMAALSRENILLRGSVLRATEWCVGIIAYHGRDTKLALNSKQAPSKLSSVDRVVNTTILIAIAVMIIVCLISMSMSISWINGHKDAHYLCIEAGDLFSRFNQGGGCTSGTDNTGLVFFTFLTLFNNFVCISMYVSLEMVYLCQAYFLENDLTIYDEGTDAPAECHTSGMCADLGQIQYVLSDKTGTLTKNHMILRRVSVAGFKYGAPIRGPGEEEEEDSGGGFGEAKKSDEGVWFPLGDLAYSERQKPSITALERRRLQGGVAWDAGSRGNDNAAIAEENRLIDHFLRVLVVCNTVILMPDASGAALVMDVDSLAAHLQAESPDEVALVLAAAESAHSLLVARSTSGLTIRKLLRTVFSPGTVREAVVGNVLLDGGDASPYNEEVVDLLAINTFESDRKRMSVLVRIRCRNLTGGGAHKTGELDPSPGGESKYLLLCKGADTSMLPLCVDSSLSPNFEDCRDHIEEFARAGLRTIVLAQRTLSEAQAQLWLVEYKAAINSLNNRQELLSRCAVGIERDLELLGAVGIEDELQDGVARAISTLLEAGLNVWMITGDKAETAQAISKQCGLLTDTHEVERIVGLSGDSLDQRVFDFASYVDRRRERNSAAAGGRERLYHEESKEPSLPIRDDVYVADYALPVHHGKTDAAPSKLALVVDGISLEGLWASPELKDRFTRAVQGVPTVIACRVSPKQKAALVRMVKNGPGNPITLAIGDGANDIGMIHAARVGVGITGKEGRHAANSADFAIGQFRFLVPLLLEHGRFNYIRCSQLILYSFFKNLVLVSTLFYFTIYSGVSGTVYVESFIFSGYNFYLGLPILALGALDFDVSKETVRKYPYLAYRTGRVGELLNSITMLRWCLFAFLQGLIAFIVTMRIILGVSADGNEEYQLNSQGVGLNSELGRGSGMYTEGFLLFTVLVIAMQVKILAMCTTVTYIHWSVWLLSFIGYFLFVYLYGLTSTTDWFHVTAVAYHLRVYWLGIIVVPVLLWLSDYIFETVVHTLFPSSQDSLLALERRDARETASQRGSKRKYKRALEKDAGSTSGSASVNAVAGAGRQVSSSRGTNNVGELDAVERGDTAGAFVSTKQGTI